MNFYQYSQLTSRTDPYLELIRKNIRLDPHPDNNKPFKWGDVILRTGMASCSEFAVYMCMTYLERGLTSTIASIGFHDKSRNYSRSHIICLVKMDDGITIRNYIDKGEYETKHYKTNNFVMAIREYMNHFIPRMLEHYGISEDMDQHYLIASPEKMQRLLPALYGKSISQKELLKKVGVDYSSIRRK